MPATTKTTPAEECLIAAEYRAGGSVSALMRRYRRGHKYIYRVLRLHHVKLRGTSSGQGHKYGMVHGVYHPTLKDIEIAAAEIREGWTEEDYRQRAGEKSDPYELPVAINGSRHNGQWFTATRNEG